MIRGFYSKREHLDDEFEKPHWNEKSGLDPRALSENLKSFIGKNRDKPMTLLRAEAFEYFLANAQIEINPHNIFADKLNTGVSYESGHAGEDIFTFNLYLRFDEEVQKRVMPDEYMKNKQADRLGIGCAWADYRHVLPDWNEILRLGFRGLLERAERIKNEKASRGELSKEQEDFYEAAAICWRAVLNLIRRYYQESLKYDIPHYSECLRHLLEHPPATMYQVLETAYITLTALEIGYEKVRSLGIIDALYYPYYAADIGTGRYSAEEIREMFRYFFNKLNAAKRFAAQPLALCGIKPGAADVSSSAEKLQCNELTHLILDVYDELRHTNPKLHFCYRPDVPDCIMEQVLRMIRKGHNSIAIINNEAVYRGYEKIGIPRSESSGYLPIGCYEPVIMGKEDAMICNVFVNIVKAVEFAANGGRDILTGELFGLETSADFNSFEDFYRTFLAHLDYIIEFFIDNIDKQTALSMEINPNPLLSATIRSCMERGRDYFAGGMQYNNTTIKCFGLATAVDSMLSVKKFVFERNVISFAELQKALRQKWKGFERVQLLIKNDRDKYGNDLEEPDRIMCDIVNHLGELIVGRKNARGGVYRLGCDSIGFCVIQGRKTGATPDGRNAREPVSKNLCAVSGMERNGVTSLMLSVLKLNHDYLLGSEPLDLMIHPSAVEGEAGIKAMNALFRAYFEKGGITLQGNVVNEETLVAAQKEPEKYRYLQIRVCGWNEYFVNLEKVKQDEFIKQAKVAQKP